jgi:integrase
METMQALGLSPDAKRLPKGMAFGKSFTDACDYWLEQHSHKRSHADDLRYAAFWKDKLAGLTLQQVTRAKLEEILDARAKEASKSTANRYRAFLLAVLNLAVDKEWLAAVPRVARYKEPKGKTNFLTIDQINVLLQELPEHQRLMAEFGLATGARQGAVKNLRWMDINLEKRLGWIVPEQSKSGKAVPLPLNDKALAVLDRCRQDNHSQSVFTYMGQKIENVNTKAWAKALTRAGLEGFRWHDLRHTWASHHAMNGTPLQALQAMGGWSDPKMVKRYAHFSPESLGGYAGNAPV